MSTAANDQSFIFITGASRSGTTMLSRIIGNAQDVLPLNELHFFGGLVPAENSSEPLGGERAAYVVAMTLARHARDFWVKEPTDQEWMTARRIVSELPAEEVTGDNLFACAMQEILRDTPAQRVCEQTPRNIYYAQHLLDVYPNAQVVHVVRDPRAVLASQKNRYQMRALGGKNVPFAEIVRLWLNYHPFSMTKLWRSATHAAQALSAHDRFHIVRYEDLITKPAATLQPLCATLGIAFSDELLDVPHYGSSTVTHSESAGISDAAMNKWQSVLNRGEIAWCERRTRNERSAFGYEDVEPAGSAIPGYLGMALRLPVHVLGALLANPGRVLTVLRAMAGGRS